MIIAYKEVKYTAAKPKLRIYKLKSANWKVKGDNQDIVVEKCVKKDDGSIAFIIHEKRIPSDWNHSYSINCYKGKGDAIGGLKLLDQMLKVIKGMLVQIIRDQIDFNPMQFGFMPSGGTIDATSILRQIQKKYLSKKKDIYFRKSVWLCTSQSSSVGNENIRC